LQSASRLSDAFPIFTVTLKDGSSYEAELVGTDPQTDVAVIKIDAMGLTPAALGDSDSLVVGELAVAVGNPLGHSHSQVPHDKAKIGRAHDRTPVTIR